MSSIKGLVWASALTIVLGTTAYADTTITIPNAEIYGKLNYHAYYNETTSGTGTWKSGNNASRLGVSISEAGDVNAFGKVEVGVNVDDDGSDTFSSRLAFLGVQTDLGSVSIGRQNSVFTGVTGATDVFNVYGSNADQNQGSRMSNTLVYSTTMGSASVSSLIQMDGTEGNKDIDKYETAVSIGAISAGYAKDANTEVDYMAVSGSVDLEGASITGMYSIKDDSGTETKGYEVVASLGDISVGYGEIVDGDTYITAGYNKSITNMFSVYAEYQLEQNISASEEDQNNYAVGAALSF